MTALQLALDGVCELAPGKHRQTHQRPEVGDQPIALVFHVEVERLARKDRRASQRPGMSSRKGQCRAFEQEAAPDPSLGFARQPEAVPVAANVECRNRRIQDAGVERLKYRACFEQCHRITPALLSRIELDDTRQLDDRFGMATIFKERILQRLRAADKQPAVEAILFPSYPVAPAVPADEGDG